MQKQEFIIGDNRHVVIPRIGRMLRSLDNKRYVVTVEPEKDSRTLQQNKAYWGVWLKFVVECRGGTDYGWHEYFKDRVGIKDFYEVGEEALVVTRSTTKYTKAEFSQYIEEVNMYVLENWQIELPQLLFGGEDKRDYVDLAACVPLRYKGRDSGRGEPHEHKSAMPW